jgi:uncharacterized membrane protein
MTAATPKTIPDYLDQLRYELRAADPALLHDALYDAEEYLRSEMAANPGVDEATLLASIATSYGAPEEVAEIYRDTEVTVSRALKSPVRPPRRGALGRFFGVAADPRAWTALFYMLLSLATGVVYFTVVVTGLSLSFGLAILIIGIPFAILFIGIVRLLSLVEGRIVEVMLGERMPRRPLYAERGQPLLSRIGSMFTDPRTWSTMLYMLLMMPLGTLYFSIAVTGMSVSLSLIFGSVAMLLYWMGVPLFDLDWHVGAPAFWEFPVALVGGVLGLFITLHVARLIGVAHGTLAKHLLVKKAQHA